MLNATDWNMFDYDLMKGAFKSNLVVGIDLVKLDNEIDGVLNTKSLVSPTPTPIT